MFEKLAGPGINLSKRAQENSQRGCEKGGGHALAHYISHHQQCA